MLRPTHWVVKQCEILSNKKLFFSLIIRVVSICLGLIYIVMMGLFIDCFMQQENIYSVKYANNAQHLIFVFRNLVLCILCSIWVAKDTAETTLSPISFPFSQITSGYNKCEFWLF